MSLNLADRMESMLEDADQVVFRTSTDHDHPIVDYVRFQRNGEALGMVEFNHRSVPYYEVKNELEEHGYTYSFNAHDIEVWQKGGPEEVSLHDTREDFIERLGNLHREATRLEGGLRSWALDQRTEKDLSRGSSLLLRAEDSLRNYLGELHRLIADRD